jgi:hypothetical protein
MSRKNRSAAPALAAPVAPESTAPVVHIEEGDLHTDEPTAEEAPTKPIGMSNLATTIRAHRHNYQPALHPISGKKTANNGDFVAAVLLITPLADLERFCYEHFGREYRTRGLNEGHIRMCCGNLVRAAFKKDDPKVCEWVQRRAPRPVAEEEVA